MPKSILFINGCAVRLSAKFICTFPLKSMGKARPSNLFQKSWPCFSDTFEGNCVLTHEHLHNI